MITPLGGLSVRVQNGISRLADGTLAGSTLTLDQAVRNLVDIGIPLQDALYMATATPASACHNEEVGLLRAGARADLVGLNRETLAVERVYLDGHRFL